MSEDGIGAEDALIGRLSALLRPTGAGVVAGIGDDCAALEGPKRGYLILLKTDCVVEGQHFLKTDSARAVGWKAACRAVSDIAACGGEPVSALVTCVVRPDQTGRWLPDLYRGIEKAGCAFDFDVVGGELSGTEGEMVISVSMTGQVSRKDFVRRGGGRPGDVLFVTGVLGGALPSGWHLKFQPRLREARWLVNSFRVRAMMDLSDGLAADLPRLARASGTGYQIDPDLVPRRRGVSRAGAMADGEDFELLLAMAPRQSARLQEEWRAQFPRLPLTRIGVLANKDKEEGLGLLRGYDHFE